MVRRVNLGNPMTFRKRPGAPDDERAAAPVQASPRHAATWSMGVWRSAVVLPHPALLPIGRSSAGEAQPVLSVRPD
jgi:hypothetical protein